MSISPPSDIVLDVVRAADPARIQAGSSKLQADGVASGQDFGAFLDAARSGSPVSTAEPRLGALAGRMTSVMPHEGARSTKDTYQSFEAFLLQSMIGSMLPAKAEGSFGKGTAGSVWKSMMAEHLATAVAKSGGIGIARILAKSEAAKAAGAVSSPSGNG